MVLIDGEPEVQKLQLAVVPVQEIAAGCAVFSGTPHVLAQAIQHGALIGVALRIIAIAVADEVFERGDPVNLVGLLERAGQHRGLSHVCLAGGRQSGRRLGALGSGGRAAESSAAPRGSVGGLDAGSGRGACSEA